MLLYIVIDGKSMQPCNLRREKGRVAVSITMVRGSEGVLLQNLHVSYANVNSFINTKSWRFP